MVSKGNILACMCEMKDELMLFLEAYGKQDLVLSIKLKELYLTKANLMDILEALNDLNSILQGKNINCINDYDAINAFIIQLGLGIVKFKKEVQPPFLQ